MQTNTVQKATLAIAATVLALVVVGYFAMAPPVAAQTSTSTSTTAQTRVPGSGMMNGFGAGGAFRQNGPMTAPGRAPAQTQVNISVGQTFTITSSSGEYFVPNNRSTNGTASGTLTFTVTGKLSEGYTLSVTSGSVKVAGTTYTIASGTAQMNRGASGVSGQGSLTPSGEFIFTASAHGTFVGSTGTVSMDLQSGSSEYLVLLSGSISG